MNIEIEKLTTWSAGREVRTQNGPRILRKGPLTAEYRAAWRANKEEMKKVGLSMGPVDRNNPQGDWEAVWWQPISGEVAKARAAAAAWTSEQEDRFTRIASKLLAYQLPSVRRLVDSLKRFDGALDASDTGTGKTFVALGACMILDLPIFIVCPKAVIPSWKRAALHFGIEINGVCNYELLRRGEQGAVALVGVGKDQEFEWRLPKNTVLIFDEVHRCKDYKTWNCAMGLAAIRQGYKVVGLSATAADNPMQMKFSGLLTRQFESEKKFFPWMLRNGVSKGMWGLEFKGGKAALDKIHRGIFPEHGTRIKIADLGDQFPETQIAAEAYDCDNAEEINRVYFDMAAELERLAQKETEDSESHLTIRLRARQRTEILKVPAIAALAQDAVDEGMSVAIFVNFNESVEALASKLKTRCFIRGGQTESEREACIASFQSDQEPVIICNIKAGGVGVSLHGSPASRMRFSIICVTDSAQDAKQALGRVWRAKGAKSIQKFFFAAGTVEEADILPNMRAKIANIDTLNDGDLALRGENVFAELAFSSGERGLESKHEWHRSESQNHIVASAESKPNGKEYALPVTLNTCVNIEQRTGSCSSVNNGRFTGPTPRSSEPRSGPVFGGTMKKQRPGCESGMPNTETIGGNIETNIGNSITRTGWRGGDAIQKSRNVEAQDRDTIGGQPRLARNEANSIGTKSTIEIEEYVSTANSQCLETGGTSITSNRCAKAGDTQRRTSASPVLGVTCEKQQSDSLVTSDLHDAVLRGLQMLAGVCDGAAMRDDMGFNGCDARIGHSLARLSRLSPKQVALGRRLLIKYRRQLPDDVNAKIRGKDTE